MEGTLEKQVKAKKRLSKGIINIIRTTMRNNIELTHIADNKANVLLSLNALMLTFLVPMIAPNIDFIKENHLVIPIVVIVITCLITIYLSALVLKPGDFDKYQRKYEEGEFISPFFFGNYYSMNAKEYEEYLNDAVSKEQLVKRHITQDLHYVGSRLGQKMSTIRLAFNIFLTGLIVSILTSIIVMFIYNG